MSEDIFDFGFTAVDEKELEVVQKTAASAEEAAASATVNEDKLNKLYNVLLFLFYCVFLPNLTLQIPSHSFVNVTFFSSTNK